MKLPTRLKLLNLPASLYSVLGYRVRKAPILDSQERRKRDGSSFELGAYSSLIKKHTLTVLSLAITDILEKSGEVTVIHPICAPLRDIHNCTYVVPPPASKKGRCMRGRLCQRISR